MFTELLPGNALIKYVTIYYQSGVPHQWHILKGTLHGFETLMFKQPKGKKCLEMINKSDS
jgi:hypothetical protein